MFQIYSNMPIERDINAKGRRMDYGVKNFPFIDKDAKWAAFV